MKYLLPLVFVSAFSLIGPSLAVSAQAIQETSTLTGLVYDDYGAVIPNAVIKIRGTDKIERIFKTNDEGAFEVKLKPGNYSIQIESPGFQTFRVDKFRVVSSYKGKQNLDIALEVGPCDGCHGIEADPIRVEKKPK